MTRKGGWDDTGFGERLRQLREEAGLSQETLAHKAGCTTGTLSRLELGKTQPAWPLVLLLADALGVKVTAFVKPERKGKE